MSNAIFIREYFMARKEAEAAGMDNEEAKRFAVAAARRAVQEQVDAILYGN
jgi:hypothetical protein